MADLTTVAKVKTLMRIKDSQQDAKIAAVIAIVSSFAETYCGRKFLTQLHAAEVHDSEGEENLQLDNYPILLTPAAPVVLDIAYPGDAGTVVDASQYFVDEKNGMLRMYAGWPSGRCRYEITYYAGLGATIDDLPAGLVGAVGIWVSQAFRAGYDAVVSEEVDDYAVHLLSSRLPVKDVAAVLDLYRRAGV